MSLRLKKERWQPDPFVPPLTLEETRAACDALHIVDYPQVERAVQDPPIEGQKYALFSFFPAAPGGINKYNVLAFAKIRGVYATEEEAATAARKIIRKTDSCNKIHTVVVGRPFPICEAIMGKVVDKVVLDDDYQQAEKEMRKRAEASEQDTTRELQDRTKALLDDVDETKAKDPVETYIVKRNKMATIAALYTQHLEQIEKFKTIMIKTHGEIIELETPEILACYQQVYDAKCQESGIVPDAVIQSYFKTIPSFDFLNNKC